MREITVLGAGIVGMTTAYALARKGFAVTVIDAAAAPAEAGASFGNGSQLSYFYTDAMATPSMAASLPKYFLGRDPAFRIKMSLSPRFLEWGMRFLFNSTQGKFERNTIDVLKLAMRGRDAFREISRSIEFDHRATGKLNIYSSRKSLEKASRLSDLKNRYGADQVILSVDESIARESSLEHYGHAFAGALWSPHDESGDSFLFCQALKRLLERDFDVKFMFNTVVKSINAKKGRICSVVTDKFEMPCSAAVLSLGSSTAFIARTIGIHVPIWPVQGYSMTVPATAHAPTASITDAARKTVFCRIGERLRIAGLADIGYGKEGFRQERFQTLFETARGIFPKAGDYNGEVSGWTGLRPVTPNSQPIVGRSKIDGVFLNCGHGTLGWTLSMATAEILAINAADSIDCRGG
ncbi:amino acid dehydrogenase [Ochrobactrum sp. P6BS-III]|uniref:FAD-dependent oxidoreductase n=1 Tax=unclassified Ochrobactrum TaxID=239106 RepID=UPI000993A3E8|nr:D-amino-acid dehydrogenase [Ochrobactrum sp. P6BSIII]OOL20311.1 amino acid dehydrogenase [Ochrobactrum sp. P6BS-III]